MVIPSFYLAYTLLQEKQYSQNVEKFLQQEFTENGYTIIYKKLNQKSNPKKIELAFLVKKFDSLEIKNLNQKLISYGFPQTELIIKQNNQDLKNEILSELNISNTHISEKDLQIQKLSQELEIYHFGDKQLLNEVKVLFPKVNQISFGVLKDFSPKDSILQQKIVVYSTQSAVDEKKLTDWLKTKFENTNIIILKK